jgi:hypothetical protein
MQPADRHPDGCFSCDGTELLPFRDVDPDELAQPRVPASSVAQNADAHGE